MVTYYSKFSRIEAGTGVPCTTPAVRNEAEFMQVAEEVRGDKDLVKVLSPNYNILKFLHPVDECGLQRIRVAAALAAATYHMKSITNAKLKRKYGLELVTTSLVCVPEQPNSLFQDTFPTTDDVYNYGMLDHGDGMAPHSDAIQASKTATSMQSTPAVETAMARLKSHYPELLHEKMAIQGAGAESAAGRRWEEPHEAAARNGYFEDSGWPHAARAEGGGDWAWDEAGSGLLDGLSRTMTAVGSAAAKAATAAAAVPPVAASIHAVGGAWESISRTAVAGQQGLSLSTISSVTAIASAGSKLQELSSVGWVSGLAAPVQVSVQGFSCSCHWFIADDTRAQVRHFVIQGTDCLESWKTNLNFEPVEFESPELKTKVHRGVYESAIVLYDIFLPLVTEHLQSHRSARVAFTGHSLGGSLATVLALMFKHRNIIMCASQLDGVITFGTAAVFCESSSLAGGSSGKGGGTTNNNHTQTPPMARDSTLLLERLGLPRTSIMNVMTTKDIVPRAFACDYKLVASVLQSWGPTYASHHGLLASNRKLLYSFAGQQMLLQPSESFAWVMEDSDPRNLLMPPGPGLWLLGPPTTLSCLVAKMHTKHAEGVLRERGVANPALESVPEAESVSDALLHCMDKPHPFTILGDARAYGPNGSISRYHNPDNYAMAVREVAVHSTSRRVQLLIDLVSFLAQEQSQRSGIAWRRWLTDWRDSAAILQQATATAAEATAIVWGQLRGTAALYQRRLLARDDVSQPLSALATSLQQARQRTAATAAATTSATTSAAAQGINFAVSALKARADSQFQGAPALPPGRELVGGSPLEVSWPHPRNADAAFASPSAQSPAQQRANMISRGETGDRDAARLRGDEGRAVGSGIAALQGHDATSVNMPGSHAALNLMRSQSTALQPAPALADRNAGGGSRPQAWLPRVGRVLATLTLLPLSVTGSLQAHDRIAGLPSVQADTENSWSESVAGGPPPPSTWQNSATPFEADVQGPSCDWPAGPR